jgi:prepilin-type N-terminal cleavage/methylation domain-containing protein/prepilin-type processing-associated H-X9-DG protein
MMKFSPRSFNGHRLSHKGFTLVELLVTIGIIALLAGLIMPSITRMREGADATQCNSNLRQVYMLFLQDMQDNDNQVPPAFNSGTDSTGQTQTVAGVPPGTGWLDNEWNQLTNTGKTSSISEKVFGCPSQRKLRKTTANKRTYSMNSIAANTYWNGANRYAPIYFSKFSQPSKTMIFSDGAYDGTPYNSAVNGSNKMPEDVHEGKVNMVFLDGHTERRKLADIPVAPGSLDTASTLNTPASIFWLGR